MIGFSIKWVKFEAGYIPECLWEVDTPALVPDASLVISSCIIYCRHRYLVMDMNT